ncbi:hypothetical protein J3R30DRAFT_944341 [Lentinula aciculospora]|uniref:C2H2-type domain-containing protein n=1 Tax=Lentinula aciculospora TaxID=153920 RepID=A0A9W9AS45_9AGAR|nr:hypothetical protein J3R30DRAFT_944341 [Lentinula aciculospora]
MSMNLASPGRSIRMFKKDLEIQSRKHHKLVHIRFFLLYSYLGYKVFLPCGFLRIRELVSTVLFTMSHNHYYNYNDERDNSSQYDYSQSPSFDHPYNHQSHLTHNGTTYIASHPLSLGAMRPQPPAVLTDFSYTTSSMQSPSWPESANTLYSVSPYSPLPQTLAEPSYGVSNQLNGPSYQNVFPPDYWLPQNNTYPEHSPIDPRLDATSHSSSSAIHADEGSIASPSSLIADEPLLKRATVASPKICHADFTTKHNLKYHLNSHNGAKPYICDFCGSSFTVPRSKDRHQKKCKNSVGP